MDKIQAMPVSKHDKKKWVWWTETYFPFKMNAFDENNNLGGEVEMKLVTNHDEPIAIQISPNHLNSIFTKKNEE
jgi:hypothetical protein